MDIVAGTNFFKISLKGILDNWTLKKVSKKNRELFQTRFEIVFDRHKDEIEEIFIDMLNEMKKDLLQEGGGVEVNYFLDQINKNLSGNVLENIDVSIDKVEQHKGINTLWKTLFYDDEMKELFNNLELNINKYKEVIQGEINNYFISGKKSDLKLLRKEKDQVVEIMKFYIPKFEQLFLNRLIGISKISLVHQIKPGVEMDNDKNTRMINNIEKFSNDIKEGKMTEYYKRIFNVVDKIMDDMIGMLEK